jgi:hypothetical protein
MVEALGIAPIDESYAARRHKRRYPPVPVVRGCWTRDNRPVAQIEVTEHTIHEQVGDALFARALALAPKVAGLAVAGPRLEARVDGGRVSVLVRAGGLAGECECAATQLCAHAIATALAWVSISLWYPLACVVAVAPTPQVRPALIDFLAYIWPGQPMTGLASAIQR